VPADRLVGRERLAGLRWSEDDDRRVPVRAVSRAGSVVRGTYAALASVGASGGRTPSSNGLSSSGFGKGQRISARSNSASRSRTACRAAARCPSCCTSIPAASRIAVPDRSTLASRLNAASCPWKACSSPRSTTEPPTQVNRVLDDVRWTLRAAMRQPSSISPAATTELRRGRGGRRTTRPASDRSSRACRGCGRRGS
jgi:hypothetical protein